MVTEQQRGAQVSRIAWLLLQLDIQRRLQAHFRIRTNAKDDPLAEAIARLGKHKQTVLDVVEIPPKHKMTFARGEPPSVRTLLGTRDAGATGAAASASADRAGAHDDVASPEGDRGAAASGPVDTSADEPRATAFGATSAASGGGQPLPANLRGDLESALGAALGGVRVHTDGAAAGT